MATVSYLECRLRACYLVALLTSVFAGFILGLVVLRGVVERTGVLDRPVLNPSTGKVTLLREHSLPSYVAIAQYVWLRFENQVRR